MVVMRAEMYEEVHVKSEGAGIVFENYLCSWNAGER